MPSASPHTFRYEPALCTLTEGQTLAEWRREDAEGRRGRRRRPTGLRARLLGARGAARRPSGR
jgi:hypothetical protein